ncbi:hypothetical protein B0A48_15992 [Cryoendolithus antarcticus]|uniref:C2H2-type domain-containing protein n=1 Tax=Cryoendolithus antarcticus TaxID=1507870 RepID=A0A1V8SGR8_9PEZI|nr:hypothetical protein B0A48_15992 [Cryoendolithus antarcticus]
MNATAPSITRISTPNWKVLATYDCAVCGEKFETAEHLSEHVLMCSPSDIVLRKLLAPCGSQPNDYAAWLSAESKPTIEAKLLAVLTILKEADTALPIPKLTKAAVDTTANTQHGDIRRFLRDMQCYGTSDDPSREVALYDITKINAWWAWYQCDAAYMLQHSRLDTIEHQLAKFLLCIESAKLARAIESLPVGSPVPLLTEYFKRHRPSSGMQNFTEDDVMRRNSSDTAMKAFVRDMEARYDEDIEKGEEEVKSINADAEAQIAKIRADADAAVKRVEDDHASDVRQKKRYGVVQ